MVGAKLWLTPESPEAALGPQPVAKLAAACATPAGCDRAFKALTAHALPVVTTDAAGHAEEPQIPSGQYYLVGVAAYQGKALVWARPVGVKPGPNVVTLDQLDGQIVH
jgi:hypothetical protein